jgi:hypothetical protein
VVAAAVAAVLATVTGARDAAAQVPEDGPVVIGQRRELETVHFDRPTVGLSLEATHGRDKTTTVAGTDRFSETVVSEILDARTQGYVLHPNFLDFSLGGSFGLTQSEADVNGASDRADGTVYTWDARGTFFRDREAPFSLYTRREEGFTDRAFGPTLETTTTESGAILDVRDRRYPTRFQASHLDTRQETLAGQEDFTLRRDAFNWTTFTQPTPDQRVTWNYNFARTNQGGVGEAEYDSHDARLTHDLTFGPADDHSLTSSLTYSAEFNQDAGDTESFRWSEFLRLKHSPDLETRYRYEFDWFDFDASERARNRATAGFVHRLYESLVTTGTVGGQTIGASGGNDEWETFADLDFDYHKRAPYGVLSADLGLGWSYNETDAATGFTQVVNRPATFADPAPIVILGTNVDPGSIVVTDATGTRLFVPGLDYVTTEFPDRVEIQRVVGGAIAAGDVVLLDYLLEPLPESTTEQTTLSAGVRYDLDRGPLRGLGAYGRYARADQRIDTPTPSAFVSGDYDDYVAGTEYRRWGFTLGAERQWHDSDVNPFEATRYFARYIARATADTTVTANATYTTLDYDEPAHTVDLLATTAGVEHRIVRGLLVRADLRWRDERDDSVGRTTGFEQEFELEWTYRQTEVYARARNARLDGPDREDEFQFFEVGLRREF